MLNGDSEPIQVTETRHVNRVKKNKINERTVYRLTLTYGQR